MTGRAIRPLGEALRAIARHPLRSLLAALTCSAAVAVVGNVISLAHGFDRDVRADVARFGARTIDVERVQVIGLFGGRERFDAAIVGAVRSATAGLVEAIVPRVHRVADLHRDDAERPAVEGVLAVGAPAAIAATLDVPLLEGRWWNDAEASAAEEAGGDVPVVLDEAIARDALRDGLEGAAAEPGRLVGARFVARRGTERRGFFVVGVLVDPMSHRAVFEEFDAGRNTRLIGAGMLAFRNVYAPLGPNAAADELTGISVVARDLADVPAVADRLLDAIDAVHPVATRPRLALRVRKAWMEALGGTTQAGAFVGNLLWMLIALVAAMLVATMSLVGVRERQDELAIRRVEGARRGDVAWQVGFESTIVAVAGGLIGLPLGALAARWLARLVEFPFRFEPRYAGVALAVAATIGALAALLPAWRAASIDPARVLARRMR